jgi:hypothetical protein
MTAITFPASPTVGQLYVATNAVTYIWTGNQWSSSLAMTNNQAKYYVEGGNSIDTYTTATTVTLEGGTA